jgi:hypothetical protein
MSFKNLNDSDLILKTKSLVGEEKKILQNILESLSEIDKRRLFASRGFGSLFDFCVQELGYSESAAYRRIASMKLIKSLPEAKKSLALGFVNLSTLSQLQTFIKKDENLKGTKLNYEEKLSLLKAIENKSQKECEREFVKLQPELIKTKESIRVVTEELTEIRFMASKKLMGKLNELKDILAHQNGSNSTHELVEILADISLKKLKSLSKLNSSATVSQNVKTSLAEIKRQVWRRDNGECQYEDPLTKRKCKMKHKVQIDHIIPKATGGDDTLENLRLLCATHNQLAAIQVFSRQHMARFVPDLK